MTAIFWTPCCTRPGAEREAQRDIEDMGLGTLHLSYRKVSYRMGKSRLAYRSLLPGYLFVALPESGVGRGAVASLESVSCVLDRMEMRDADRLNTLAMRCLTGEFNVTERKANGQFASKPKKKKRNRKSRRGKRVGNPTNIQACSNQRTNALSMLAVA